MEEWPELANLPENAQFDELDLGAQPLQDEFTSERVSRSLQNISESDEKKLLAELRAAPIPGALDEKHTIRRPSKEKQKQIPIPLIPRRPSPPRPRQIQKMKIVKNAPLDKSQLRVKKIILPTEKEQEKSIELLKLYKTASEKREKSLKIEPSEIENAGQGLFTLKKIPKDAIITEYTGVPYVIKNSKIHDELFPNTAIYATTADQLPVGTVIYDKMERKYTVHQDQKNATWPIIVIDGKSKKNIGRYANDLQFSNNKFVKKNKNNTQFTEQHGHVFLQANKIIEKGEEITVSYGEEYWEHFLEAQEELESEIESEAEIAEAEAEAEEKKVRESKEREKEAKAEIREEKKKESKEREKSKEKEKEAKAKEKESNQQPFALEKRYHREEINYQKMPTYDFFTKEWFNKGFSRNDNLPQVNQGKINATIENEKYVKKMAHYIYHFLKEKEEIEDKYQGSTISEIANELKVIHQKLKGYSNPVSNLKGEISRILNREEFMDIIFEKIETKQRKTKGDRYMAI